MGISLAAACATPPPEATQAEIELLPDPFPVYALDNGVVNHPHAGGERRDLPTRNAYRGVPGCYLACYSRDRTGAVYSVGGGIQVMGQVRVPGRYQGRICRPEGYEKADISALGKFKSLCNGAISSCKDSGCWAGGDTGGWFGIPG